MMTHGVRVDCCLNSNAYFVYWQSHSARNEPHRWRRFFDKNPNHFQVVAQPNLQTYGTSGSPRSFRKIRHNDVTEMPNAWECRVRDTFWLFSTEASAAAIFSTLRALLCLTGTGTFCTVPVDSYFSTRRSIVDLESNTQKAQLFSEHLANIFTANPSSIVTLPSIHTTYDEEIPPISPVEVEEEIQKLAIKKFLKNYHIQ